MGQVLEICEGSPVEIQVEGGRVIVKDSDWATIIMEPRPLVHLAQLLAVHVKESSRIHRLWKFERRYDNVIFRRISSL